MNVGTNFNTDCTCSKFKQQKQLIYQCLHCQPLIIVGGKTSVAVKQSRTK